MKSLGKNTWERLKGLTVKLLLSDEVQRSLRANNVITATEVVYRFGDLFVAENSVTGEKRNLQNVPLHIVENTSSKSLLKG